MGGGRAAGLARSDADPGEKHGREPARKAARRGHDRPDQQRGPQNGDTAAAIGKACDRNAQQRIDDGESQAGQQTGLGVAQMKARLHRLQNYRNDVAVVVVERRPGE